VRRWFDQHLAGIATGIDKENPVVLRPRGTNTVESGADWASATGKPVRYPLGAPRWYDSTGALGASAAGGWEKTVWAGVDTVAHGGIAILTNGWEALTGIPPGAWMPAVSRPNAMVWVSDTLHKGGQVRGIVRTRLTVTPSVTDGTLVAYLYDMDALGGAKLVTHVPYTGGIAGQPHTAEIAFPATAYNVPAGHRLALVVDTKDPLYLDINRFGKWNFSSPVADPSWLEVPLR
jgi:predicted acyl esterase